MLASKSEEIRLGGVGVRFLLEGRDSGGVRDRFQLRDRGQEAAVCKKIAPRDRDQCVLWVIRIRPVMAKILPTRRRLVSDCPVRYFGLFVDGHGAVV